MIVLNVNDAELLVEALESLTDEQLPVGLRDLLVIAANIAAEKPLG